MAVFDHEGALIGVAPWFIENRGGDGRVVQFLGSGHVCTEYLTILSRPEHRHEVVTAVAQWLIDVATGQGDPQDQWDLLDFDSIPLDDVPLRELTTALQSAGCSCNRRPAMGCWRMSLPTSWDELSNGLRPSHAKQVRRVRRKVFDSGRAEVRTLQDDAGLEAAMRIIVDLHQRRWTSLGEPGCFASPEFHGFLHASAADLFAAGMLQLNWLQIDGRPVAAEFLLATPHALYAYQGGLDPASRKESPGHALMSTILQDAIVAGRQSMDFLRGDEAYKATWGAECYPTERIRIAPDRLSAQLRNHAWFAGQVMKSWVKQGLTLTGIH